MFLLWCFAFKVLFQGSVGPDVHLQFPVTCLTNEAALLLAHISHRDAGGLSSRVQQEQSDVSVNDRAADSCPAGCVMLKWCELTSVWWLLTPLSNQPAGTDAIELLGLQRRLPLHAGPLLRRSVALFTHWAGHQRTLAPADANTC